MITSHLGWSGRAFGGMGGGYMEPEYRRQAIERQLEMSWLLFCFVFLVCVFLKIISLNPLEF